ncbi:2,4-dihydroxyhept-2-ene-1,7-dioic acid aldolase [Amylibacter marinus]|uniref:2,4-dihydroxyhept-2-ene-1,7-dioic acid aldolase n=1 Tax=Amylibacter marinus TaxID=1475483 RepID=A0ABQ5VUQ8_9RHOB|nr:HpcH/HpaI aldolase/citrate lyase family protein [Amylibacter marinus]GLQ35172.1 2,4-dihydroxyhept-2-ene-1,7-dioic acid aldolase [Amylibacter marinus]
MQIPKNPFKAAIHAGEMQTGCWLGLAEPYLAEISGSAGFDWVVVDAEHAPNDLRSIVTHLQILDGLPSHAVVRPPIGETWMIKQYLEAGAQTVLVPMVESAEQARQLVRAISYPPHGTRGVGSALGRSSRFTAIPDYLNTAHAELCLLVQIETRAGVAALDDILAVDGIDGVFIGPADLAADMGHIGNPGAPEVHATIITCMRKIIAAGTAAGILTTDAKLQSECAEIGARFIATSIDVTLFANAMRGAATQTNAHLKGSGK